VLAFAAVERSFGKICSRRRPFVWYLQT
jgi:hypothetical protein